VEFLEVVRRRRMVRDFGPRPVPDDKLERVLEAALHGPSAGFAQGLELIVLDRPPDLERFWSIIDPSARKLAPGTGAPPVIVIPLAGKAAYLRRYSAPDKRGLGMDVEEGWPVAYWDLDAAMAVMLMLLAAIEEGLGAWFFGIFHGEASLVSWLGVPGGYRPIGALGLGYPSESERRRGSPASHARRTLEDVVHWGGWS
jgi:nitroreductase